MQTNKAQITGVLNHAQSEKKYTLRRYLPEAPLACLVEQFWLVDWHLPKQQTHTQENLPDPNFHLVIDASGAQVIGPVNRKYTYTMKNSGSIIGVKFQPGAMVECFSLNALECVDKRLTLEELFNQNSASLQLAVSTIQKKASCNLEQRDSDIVNLLSILLQPFAIKPSNRLKKVQSWLQLIQQQPSIMHVEQLSQQANVSLRTLQRGFNQYIGLSPKWLIRKYRLHQALARLDKNEISLAQLSAELGYTDQAHFSRDFNLFIGRNPGVYVNNKSHTSG